MNYVSHQCDICGGTVQGRIARSEVVRMSSGVVLVEGFEVGICRNCGHRYWPAAILKRAERVAEHPEEASYIIDVPVLTAQ